MRESKGTITAFDALGTPRSSAVSLFRTASGKAAAAVQVPSAASLHVIQLPVHCLTPDLTSFRVHRVQDVLLWRDTAARAGWTLRYARINVLALRKILKKHDKVMKSYFGKELLQVQDDRDVMMCCPKREYLSACQQLPWPPDYLHDWTSSAVSTPQYSN